jgi:hypothetical protein
MQEANAFLPAFLARHNRSFSVAPATPGSAYRPRLSAADLDQILCFKHERVVSNDNIARLGQVILQILPGPNRLGYAKATVAIHESLDHRFSVHYNGRQLPAKLVPLQKFLSPKPAPSQPSVPPDRPPTPQLPRKPQPAHPWRRSLSRTKSLGS